MRLLKVYLKRVLLFPLWWRCNWHRGDIDVSYADGSAGCPECGCLLDTKYCDRCGKCFLDWGAKGFDDVIAAPTVTESGDVMCVRCAQRCREDEKEAAEYDDYYDDVPD